MKTKKPTTPSTDNTKRLENVEIVQLEDVVGGCACGCGMANCDMQMAPRQPTWR